MRKIGSFLVALVMFLAFVPVANGQSFEQQVADLVNQERAKAGLSP